MSKKTNNERCESSSLKNTPRAPRSRLCHVCGRQTLIAGFEHHVKQCSDLFLKREALKPKKERRSIPEDPYILIGGNKNYKNNDDMLEELNNLSFKAFNSNLSTCDYCGRKFIPEKLEIHNRSCTQENPARRVNVSNTSRDNVPTSSIINSSLPPPSSFSSTTSNLKTTKSNFQTNLQSSSSFIPAEFIPCPDCGRTFNEIAYSKHSKICKKVFVQKRKVFDSSKARIKGTDLEEFKQFENKTNKISKSTSKKYPKDINKASSSMMINNGKVKNVSFSSGFTEEPPSNSSSNSNSNSSSNWRNQSNSFREAIAAARMIKKAEAFSKSRGIPLHQVLSQDDRFAMPVPKSSVDPTYANYVECPTCGRSYNKTAAERHIPQCKNIIHKPSRLISHTGKSATTNSVIKSGSSIKMADNDREVEFLSRSSINFKNGQKLSSIDEISLNKSDPKRISQGRNFQTYSAPMAGSVLVLNEESRKIVVNGRKRN